MPVTHITGNLTVQDNVTIGTSGTGNLTVDDNATFGGPRPWIDVRKFGASGGGTQDDSQEIQLAINSLNQGEGGVIFLPKGTYLIGEAINIDRPVTFQGEDPEQTTLLFAQSSQLQANSHDVEFRNLQFKAQSGTMYPFALKTTGAMNCERWTFWNCFFNAMSLTLRKVGWNGAGTAGTDHYRDIQILNCRVEEFDLNGGYAVDMRQLEDVTTDGCLIQNNQGIGSEGTEGIKVAAASKNIRIVNTVSRGNSRDGIDIYDASRVTILNCHFSGNTFSGIEAKWLKADPTKTEKSVIAFNRIDGNGGHGIFAESWNILVFGNVIEGTSTNNVAGIYINRSSDDSAPEPTQRAIFANNHISGFSDGYGIYIGEAKFVSVLGNFCISNRNGIFLATPSANCLLANNQCHNNQAATEATGNRDFFVNGTKHILDNNIVSNANGIQVSTADATLILRDGYGEEDGTAGSPPTLANWPVGAIVKNRTDTSFWLRIPTTAGWTALKIGQELRATATWDPASFASGAVQSTTISVPGAATGTRLWSRSPRWERTTTSSALMCRPRTPSAWCSRTSPPGRATPVRAHSASS
jgi:parallel beta-helix repeat protein